MIGLGPFFDWIRKKFIRFSNSKYALGIIGCFVLFAPPIWFFLAYLSLTIFPPGAGSSANTIAYILWAVSSLVLVTATGTVLWGERSKFSATTERIQNQYIKTLSNIERDVIRYVDTSIVFKKSHHEMRVLLQPQLEAFKSSPVKDIVILGADTLRLSVEAQAQIKDKIQKPGGAYENEVERIHYNYSFLFNEILGSPAKKLTRFIYLFRPQDLQGRTPEFRKDYLAWLRDQLTYFPRNDNYTIVHTPRATVWGAPKSIIFLNKSIAEIFFRPDGGGVLLTSQSEKEDAFVAAARASLIEGYVDEPSGPARTRYSNQNIQEFEQYVALIRAEVEIGTRSMGEGIVFAGSPHAMREVLLPALDHFSKLPEQAEITILGADQLRPSVSRLIELKDRSSGDVFSGEEEIELKYGNVLNSILSGSQVGTSEKSDAADADRKHRVKTLKRYISLFTIGDLSRRTPRFRKGYARWLREQVGFLTDNEGYEIIDTPRAIVWGAPKSMIFFRKYMVEVFATGGGIVMTEEQGGTAAAIQGTRRMLIDDYINSADGPKRIKYSKSKLADFEKYVKSIEDDVDPPNGKH